MRGRRSRAAKRRKRLGGGTNANEKCSENCSIEGPLRPDNCELRDLRKREILETLNHGWMACYSGLGRAYTGKVRGLNP